MPQMNPALQDVRVIDPVLTNVSIGFKNEKFLWDKLAPPVRVNQRSGTYFIYTRDFWMRRQRGAVRAEGARYTRVGYGVSTGTYETIENGYEKVLDDPTAAASQTPEALATIDLQYITNLLQLEMEKKAAADYFVSGKWTTDTTLSGANQWSDFAGSDPIANADAAARRILRNTGARPNVLFLGLTAWEKLKEHPLVLDKYKYTQVGIMTPQLVAPVMGVEELIIGDSVENTAAEGATYAGADIWTDNALFLVRNNPTLGVMNGAYTYIWDEAGAFPWAVQSYRDEPARGNVQRIFNHSVNKVVAAQFGDLFIDCVA